MEKTPSSQYKIRFSDCDLFGHLNNSRYLDYMINAREDHLSDHYNFDLTEHYKNGSGWVVGSHEITYMIAAVYNEVVSIQSSLLLAEDDYLLVETIMSDAKKTHLKAVMRTKLVHVNLTTGRKEKHNGPFLEWAKTIVNTEINANIPLQQRIKDLKEELKSSII